MLGVFIDQQWISDLIFWQPSWMSVLVIDQ